MGRAGEAAGSERCTSIRLPDEREWGTDALMTCAPRTDQQHVNLSARNRWETPSHRCARPPACHCTP